MKYLLLFSLFLAVSKGCGDKKIDGIRTADYGDEVTIAVGEALRIKDTESGFLFFSVERDSRCPRGANCIQAGAATIVVEEMTGSPRQINIPAEGSRNRTSFTINRAKIEILSLAPYPTGGEKIDPADYALTVKISEGNPTY